jgi:hypothetical protein
MVLSPELNFVKRPTEATNQTGIDNSRVDVADDLMPIWLNRFLSSLNKEVEKTGFFKPIFGGGRKEKKKTKKPAQ